MTMHHSDLITDVVRLGATKAAIIQMEGVRFHAELRTLCERNACGSYGKSWGCPPHVGPLDELAARVRSFDQGLLFQCVTEIEDSYDIEGMGRGAAYHKRVVREMADVFRATYEAKDILVLGSGPCDICSECTVTSGEPCRHPDLLVSSAEAYGMNVKDLVEKCGFSYINGKNTVSYVGLILFHDKG